MVRKCKKVKEKGDKITQAGGEKIWCQLYLVIDGLKVD